MKIDIVAARKIVAAIVDDMRDRSGLQNEWENIDDETQAEILRTWVEIITATEA